jgi:succinoglycan biosynthesis transport protein ExoP
VGQPAIEPSNDVNLGYFSAAIWRQRWSTICIFAAFMVLSVLTVNVLTPRYTAELSMMLNMKTDSGGITESLSGGIVSKDMAEMATAINAVTSYGTIRQVINTLSLQNDPEFNPLLRRGDGLLGRLGIAKLLPSNVQAIIWGHHDEPEVPSLKFMVANTEPVVAKGLSVVSDGKSYTISISFTALEGDKAAKIANAFGDWYVQHRKDWRSHQLDQISNMLMEKSENLRQRVVESEVAVETYRQEHGIVNLGNENTLNVDALTKLNSELIRARGVRAEAEANLREMQRFAVDESREAAARVVGSNSPNLVALVDQQNQFRAQLAELSRQYLGMHPAVLSMKSKLGEVTAELKTETDRVLAGLRARVQVAQSNEEQIQTGMSQLTAASQRTARAGSELTRLESERDAARTVYQTFLEGGGRVGVEASAQAFDTEIISPAVPPIWPSFPQKRLIIGLSVVCGLMLSTAIAILLDAWRRGIYTAEEVVSLRNVRFLGMVPKSSKRILAAEPSLSMLTISNPLGAHTEAIRSIGVSLALGFNTADRKVILVTSALPGEGKTSLVLSLGRLAAAVGKSVLVIEGDLRHPTLQRALKPAEVGLVDVLTGKVELHQAIQIDHASGLRYVCAGSKALYPAELLNSRAMNAVMDIVRESFDLIVIDAPPIGVVSDALVLSTRADATIMVLRSGKTDKRAYSMAFDQISQFGTAITGVVLSHVAPREFLKYRSNKGVYGYFVRSDK